MGWSCNRDAGLALDRWKDACVASTGQTNTWEANGTRYFFEVSRTEHWDGAITGSIWRMLPNDRCRRAGTFRIEGDGTITRAPKFLKAADLNARTLNAVYGREEIGILAGEARMERLAEMGLKYC